MIIHIYILVISFIYSSWSTTTTIETYQHSLNHQLRRSDSGVVNQSIFTLLQQTNGKQLYYDYSSRLICTKFTDIYKFPLIQVTDDFILPSMDTGIDVSECISLVFNIT